MGGLFEQPTHPAHARTLCSRLADLPALGEVKLRDSAEIHSKKTTLIARRDDAHHEDLVVGFTIHAERARDAPDCAEAVTLVKRDGA